MLIIIKVLIILGTTLQDYQLVDIRDETFYPFMKFEIILPPPSSLFFISPHKKINRCLTNINQSLTSVSQF